MVKTEDLSHIQRFGTEVRCVCGNRIGVSMSYRGSSISLLTFVRPIYYDPEMPIELMKDQVTPPRVRLYTFLMPKGYFSKRTRPVPVRKFPVEIRKLPVKRASSTSIEPKIEVMDSEKSTVDCKELQKLPVDCSEPKKLKKLVLFEVSKRHPGLTIRPTSELMSPSPKLVSVSTNTEPIPSTSTGITHQELPRHVLFSPEPIQLPEYTQSQSAQPSTPVVTSKSENLPVVVNGNVRKNSLLYSVQ